MLLLSVAAVAKGLRHQLSLHAISIQSTFFNIDVSQEIMCVAQYLSYFIPRCSISDTDPNSKSAQVQS